MILERLLLCGVLMAGGIAVDAEELVILHTNDTHSQIEPNDRDLGGILRRKVLVDSVRTVHDNVLLIDAAMPCRVRSISPYMAAKSSVK